MTNTTTVSAQSFRDWVDVQFLKKDMGASDLHVIDDWFEEFTNSLQK